MRLKAPSFAATLLFLASVPLLPAQTIGGASGLNEIASAPADHLEGRDQKRFTPKPAPGVSETLPDRITQARRTDKNYSFLAQEASLGLQTSTPRSLDQVVDFDALHASAAEAAAGDLSGDLATISAAYRAPGEAAVENGCPTVGLSVQQQVKLNPGKILEVVESEVTANSSCACEVVKAALLASAADETLTAKVVETAVIASPENLRLISQCAIAIVPEALAAVQGVVSKYEPSGGEGSSTKSGKEGVSAKDSKDPVAAPKVENAPNPLDLTNFPVVVPVPVIITIDPDPVTDVNP